jgi:acyl carrier protein
MAQQEMVRDFILETFDGELRARALQSDDVPDDFDLLLEGVIDSLGMLELIGALEERFGVRIELEEMDPDHVTVVGPLSEYVADRVSSPDLGAHR